MLRSSVSGVVALVALSVAGLPVAAQSNEELARKVEALTRRVESLERGNASASAKPTPRPAPNAQARAEAEALYSEVDVLLADGKTREANAAVAAFETKHAGGAAIGWTGSLKRELQVIGKATPDNWFIEKWYQGESEVDLDGPPTLLVFWESWCPHCRTEVPKMQQLHDEYRAKGLQVVGVTRITRDATEAKVLDFLASYDVRYPMVKVTEPLAEYFDVKGIPAAAVIKNGKIVWRGHPLRVTPEMIGKWL